MHHECTHLAKNITSKIEVKPYTKPAYRQLTPRSKLFLLRRKEEGKGVGRSDLAAQNKGNEAKTETATEKDRSRLGNTVVA